MVCKHKPTKSFIVRLKSVVIETYEVVVDDMHEARTLAENGDMEFVAEVDRFDCEILSIREN